MQQPQRREIQLKMVGLLLVSFPFSTTTTTIIIIIIIMMIIIILFLYGRRRRRRRRVARIFPSLWILLRFAKEIWLALCCSSVRLKKYILVPLMENSGHLYITLQTWTFVFSVFRGRLLSSSPPFNINSMARFHGPNDFLVMSKKRKEKNVVCWIYPSLFAQNCFRLLPLCGVE